MWKKKDLTGQKFDRINVIRDTGERDKNGKVIWDCVCDCQMHKPENEREHRYITGSRLTTGNVRSCGCLAKEVMSKVKSKINKYDLVNYPYGVFYTLNTNRPVIFDKDDFYKIFEYGWTEHIDKKKNYSRIEAFNKMNINNNFDDKRVVLHQVITGIKYIDHFSQDTADNRKENLRPASEHQQGMNRSYRKTKDGIIGVNYSGSKYIAYITYDEEKIYLKCDGTFKDAVKARLQAEHDYYGIFSPQRHLFAEYGIDDSDLDYWAATFANPEVQKKYGYEPSLLPTEEDIKKYSQPLEIKSK